MPRRRKAEPEIPHLQEEEPEVEEGEAAEEFDEEPEEEEEQEDEPVVWAAPTEDDSAPLSLRTAVDPMLDPLRPHETMASLNKKEELVKREKALKLEKELATFLSAWDFTGSNHKVELYRQLPRTSPKYPGIKLSGFCEEFFRPISASEIKNRWGGTDFRLLVKRRTSPDTDQWVFVTGGQATLEVSGEPKYPEIDDAAPKKEKEESEQLVKSLIADKTKEAQQQISLLQKAHEREKDLMSTMFNNQQALLDRVASAMVNPASKDAVLEMQKEHATQLSNVLDKLETKHEKTLETLKTEMNKQLEVMQKGNGAESNMLVSMMQMMQTMTTLMVNQAQSAAAQQVALLQDTMKAQAAAAQAAADERSRYLEKELTVKAKDPFAEMERTFKLFELFKSRAMGEPEPPLPTGPNWQEIAKVIAPVLERTIQAFRPPMALPSGAPAPRQLPAASTPPAPIRPGIGAVIEAPLPANTPLPRGWRERAREIAAKGKPQTQQPAPQTPPVVDVKPQEVKPVPPTEEVEVKKTPPTGNNDFTEFQFPGMSLDPRKTITILAKDVDLAIQRGLSVDAIKSDIVDKFPKPIIWLLEKASVEDCVKTLSEEAPPHWAINSVAGRKIVEQLHGKLKA